MFVLGIISGAIHISLYLSADFAEYFNRNIASYARQLLASLTNVLPFSFAETIILFLPVVIVCLFIIVNRIPSNDNRAIIRYVASTFAVSFYLYSAFVICFASAYRVAPLSEKLDLEPAAVTAEELEFTARELYAEIEELLPEVTFKFASSSVMPYSLDEMNDKLNDAYSETAEKYGFIRHFKSNVKYIALSEPMTYTHISGVYAFFTGEANINVNFPDYTIPFTAAHEFSHQRGVGPENEANFMAFLVCSESDDAYVRYSGYMSIFEYVLNALYQADTDAYFEVICDMDDKVRYEMIAYNEFFAKYRDSVASDITGAINDSYLQSQGQSAGSRSYGMVVDLAVAYYKNAK